MSETVLDRALLQAFSDLDTRGVPCALVGGLAVSLRAEVRFTRDVDVAISIARDDEVEALVRDLQSAGYRVKALVEHDERMRIATVRLLSQAGVVIDLLSASSGIEAEVVTRAEEFPWSSERTVPVARSEELVALKVLSAIERRPQDLADIHSLVKAGITRSEVESNLALIESRGFSRGQDLLAKFRSLVATA